ncbi:MAG: peptidyl-prolyl cis-trans isomerase [Nitrospirota bacterium]
MIKLFLSFLIIILFPVSIYADDIVVARVNEVALTLKDLDAEVDRLIPRITFHRSVSGEKRKQYYEKALEELINRELQFQDAISKGIKPDKEKVNAQMEKIRSGFKSEEEYKAALEKEGITEEKLQAKVEKDMLVQSVVAKTVTKPAWLSEAELKSYYENNTSRFKQPEGVRLRLVSTKDEKKAMEILTKIKAGEDFGDLAAKMSEDSYRVKGGDIGYIHKGRMLPEIEDVAFKLQVGEVSDLIKTEGGWLIIKVEDKRSERQLSFDEIKSKLKKELETKRAQELKEKWIADLRSKAKIEVLLPISR